MPKFRSRPVEVEAAQFHPSHRPLPFQRYGSVVCLSPAHGWYVMTRSGSVGLRPGDWLIKTPDTPALFVSEVMRSDVFAATYEAVEDVEEVQP